MLDCIASYQYNKNMSSKAAQILRTLNNQIQHQKSAPSHPLAPVTEINLLSAQPKIINIPPPQSQKQILPTQKSNIILDAKIKYQNSQKAPQFLTQMLKQQKKSMHKDIFNKVDGFARQREKRIYFGLATAPDQYFQVLVQQVKDKQTAHFDAINGLMAKRSGKVQVDLEEGSLFVQHQRNISNKKQIERLEKIDIAKMIKIKDGELRSKMDILSHKLDQLGNIEQWDLDAEKRINQEIQKKLAQNMDNNNYALDSERTKIAKDYVRHMQQQRVFFQKRKKERQARYQKQEGQRQAELKQAEQMKDLAKRQQMMQKIEARKKKREQEQKQQEAQEEQAKRILAEYHRKLPIFKIKQKQFQQKFIKPEKQRREQKLNQIRQQRRSLSLHQIKKHESLYLNKLRSQRAKRKEQISLIIKSRQAEDKKKDYYKGSAHARIKEMTKQDILRNYSLREASKLKANRMKEYGQVIYKNYQPTVDEQKKKELQRLIEEDIMKKKHARKVFKQVVDQTTNQIKFQSHYEEIPEKNRYKEGNRLFEEARKNLKKKDEDSSKEKTTETEPQSNSAAKVKLLYSSNAESQKKGLNLWELRAKQLQQMANSEIVDAKNFDHLKKNIQNLDSKAAQKQDLLKKIELNMGQHIDQKSMLDHYYLQSIRQKMKLLE